MPTKSSSFYSLSDKMNRDSPGLVNCWQACSCVAALSPSSSTSELLLSYKRAGLRIGMRFSLCLYLNCNSLATGAHCSSEFEIDHDQIGGQFCVLACLSWLLLMSPARLMLLLFANQQLLFCLLSALLLLLFVVAQTKTTTTTTTKHYLYEA